MFETNKIQYAPLTWPSSALQVLSSIPDTIHPQHGGEGAAVYILTVQVGESLGTSGDDFSNVQVKRVEGEVLHPIDDGEVYICPGGKLGSLAKGLRHIADHTPKISQQEVVQKHLATMAAALQKKRTGLLMVVETLIVKLLRTTVLYMNVNMASDMAADS